MEESNTSYSDEEEFIGCIICVYMCVSDSTRDVHEDKTAFIYQGRKERRNSVFAVLY